MVAGTATMRVGTPRAAKRSARQAVSEAETGPPTSTRPSSPSARHACVASGEAGAWARVRACARARVRVVCVCVWCEVVCGVWCVGVCVCLLGLLELRLGAHDVGGAAEHLHPARVEEGLELGAAQLDGVGAEEAARAVAEAEQPRLGPRHL